MTYRIIIAVALASFAVGLDFAQDAKDKDYAADLPRIPPKSPAESQKCFQLRPEATSTFPGSDHHYGGGSVPRKRVMTQF